MSCSGRASWPHTGKAGDLMGYVSSDQIAKAKEMDLLTYLQTFEPDELVKIGPYSYCTRTHDSLKISNGLWHWFSRNTGGKNALEYLMTVKGMAFPDAVELLSGEPAIQATPRPTPKKEQQRILRLPPKNGSTERVEKYLQGRGILPSVIAHCIGKEILYESADYHNAVFVGRDREGVPRYASLRGTWNDFKLEASGSDKHYSFSIVENPNAKTVHIFEAAIDLMSFASLRILWDQDWKQDAMLSLAGVFQTKREKVVPVALEQFLKDHPQIHTLRLHLDNDKVGRSAAKGIMEGLADRYQVFDDPPPRGKDVNEYLQLRQQSFQRKEKVERE